jgi:hypothetical protein
MMKNNNGYITFWQKWLGLASWSILSESIDKKQVLYDKDVPKKDRYFVGVHIDDKIKVATIYHDRKLTHEYVLHELLHIRFPKFTEEQVNERCDKILNMTMGGIIPIQAKHLY